MRQTSTWGPWVAGALLLIPLLLAAEVFAPPSRDRVADPAGPGVTLPTAGTPVDSIARAALRRAPFRIDGRAAPVPYDPSAPDPAAQASRPPKPVLVLTGIAGGRNPMVVIGGVPGHDGAMLLGVGDTMGGLRVRRVADGVVTITGMDTTWTLQVKGAQ